MSILHMKQPPPTWWSNRWWPRWTHDHWKTSAKSSQWCWYPILKMTMVKSMHVTLKVAREWGARVSGTLDIFEWTGNSLSPWSTRNSQSSWSYGLTYALPYVVHKLPYEPLTSLDRWRHDPSTIITSHRLIVYIMSRHISQIGWPTVSMLSYPWPWRPRDIRQVSETGICHGTKVSHQQTLSYQSSNNKQELILTQSVKGEQRY